MANNFVIANNSAISALFLAKVDRNPLRSCMKMAHC